MKRSLLSGLCILALGACVDTGQERTAVPLFVAGVDVFEPFEARGGATVVVERADLAFGPLYLCAGATAGELCDTARLEWLGTAVVDTTRAEPERVGDLSGVTGPVRSWMFDLGISSQLTHPEPVILDAARALGGQSLVVQGRAFFGGIELPFEATVAVKQTENTELGVPVVRKSASESFFHDITPAERGLLVRFDPRTWLTGVDFSSYVLNQACALGGPPTVCAGAVETSCEDDGSPGASRNCAELGQVCAEDHGCLPRLELLPNTEAHRSVKGALVSSGRPSFEWDVVP